MVAQTRLRYIQFNIEHSTFNIRRPPGRTARDRRDLGGRHRLRQPARQLPDRRRLGLRAGGLALRRDRTLSLHRLHRRRRRRSVRPEILHQNLGRDELASPQEQQCQKRPLLGRSNRDLAAVVPQNERTQDPKLHTPSIHQRRRGRLYPAFAAAAPALWRPSVSYPSDRKQRS